MRSDQLPTPTESIEQQRLFQWAAMMCGRYPELDPDGHLFFHIPNEGKRTRANGARLKAEGMRKGTPDICLAVPRGKSHGLYIELKRLRGGRLEKHQADALDALRAQGYAVAVCNGWESAAKVIEEYLQTR